MRIKEINIVKYASRIFLLAALFISFGNVSCASEPNDENDIKALFILNFIKYVNWPEGSEKSSIIIGIAGESPVYYSLVKIIFKRSENNNIKVEKINNQSKGTHQIVFVSEDELGKIDKWKQKYSNKGVLLISENCKNKCGAAINLFTLDNKIKFDIDTKGAQMGGVKISSKLMELASSVQP
jgi:hypothetical protein